MRVARFVVMIVAMAGDGLTPGHSGFGGQQLS